MRRALQPQANPFRSVGDCVCVYFRQYRPRSTWTNNSVQPPGLPTLCFGRKVPAQSMESAAFTSAGTKIFDNLPAFTASLILRIVSLSINRTLPARGLRPRGHIQEYSVQPTITRPGRSGGGEARL